MLAILLLGIASLVQLSRGSKDSTRGGVTLDVDWPTFLGSNDHIWNFQWRNLHKISLSPISSDLQFCGDAIDRSCCVTIVDEEVQLGPCVSSQNFTFSVNGSIINDKGLCLSVASVSNGSNIYKVKAERCSSNTSIWVTHENTIMTVNLPALQSNPTSERARSMCLNINTPGNDWCISTICPEKFSTKFISSLSLNVVPCLNGDRRQFFQIKTVENKYNFVPESWATAAYAGNGLVGARVQNAGLEIMQGSRTKGSIGILRIDIDNVLLGQGKRRQANGYFNLKLTPNITDSSTTEFVVTMRTHLFTASIEANVTELGSDSLVAAIKLFVNANLSLPVVVLECEQYDGLDCELIWVQQQNQSFAWKNNTVIRHSNAANELTYVSKLTAFACVSSKSISDAASNVNQAVAQGTSTLFSSHCSWWRSYWPSSFVSVGENPDSNLSSFATVVSQHYWTQMYRFPTSDRVGILGIIGSLGPTGFSPANWNSDYYWDMNEELMYWISPASNRPELSVGLDSLPSNTIWMLAQAYKQYLFKGDDTTLAKRLFPKLQSIIRLQVGVNNSLPPNGTYHVKHCNSPEYGCWAPFNYTCAVKNGEYEDCSYMISQLKWALRTLIDLATKYQLNVPIAEFAWWNDLYERQLAQFPADQTTGYRLSKDCAFSCPHRHFSHLLQIFDFEVVNPRSDVSRKSIDWYYGLTCNASNFFNEACRGYSLCGIAGMNALSGRARAAEGNLTLSLRKIITPNGMYGEDEIFNHPDEFGPTGESSYCIAGVLQTMLVHYSFATKVLSVFTVSDFDASFYRLRAANNMVVSGQRVRGRVEFIEVVCDTGCVNVSVSVPSDNQWDTSKKLIRAWPSSIAVIAKHGQTWSFSLSRNSSVVLYPDTPLLPDFVVRAIEMEKIQENYYGYSQAFPPTH